MPRGFLNCSFDARPYGRDYGDVSQNSVWPEGHAATLSQQYFVTLHNALTSSIAVSQGIVRRASFFGGTSSSSVDLIMDSPSMGIFRNRGQSMGYWDEPTTAGNNAWALFEFTQANPKFWVLIQFASVSREDYNQDNKIGVTSGTSAQSQLIYPSYTTTGDNGVVISIAFKEDGTSPWNGTTNNNGSDTKGNPVWINSAAVFPRSNSFRGGINSGSRNSMMHVMYERPLLRYDASDTYKNQFALARDCFDGIYHIIFDKENLMIATDPYGMGYIGGFFYFGKYAPYTSHSASYVSFATDVSFDDSKPPLIVRNYGKDQPQYGLSFDGGDSSAEDRSYLLTGALSYFPINGGIYDNAIGNGQTAACSLHIDEYAFTSSLNRLQPYLQVYNQTSTAKHFVKNPIIAIDDYPNRTSIMGKVSFFKLVSEVQNMSYFANKTEVVLGSSKKSNLKLVIPWNSNIEYGIKGRREGFGW